MAENSSDEASHDPWQFAMETGPDRDILINGKEIKGFEEFILKTAHDHKLNWWELGNLLLYMAVGQIAAADHMAEDNEGLMNFSVSFAQFYRLHREALLKGDNMIANPRSDETIN